MHKAEDLKLGRRRFSLNSGVYQKTGVTTQPKVVAYNGGLLKYQHAGTTILQNEWDWAASATGPTITASPPCTSASTACCRQLRRSKRRFGIFDRSSESQFVRNLLDGFLGAYTMGLREPPLTFLEQMVERKRCQCLF